MEAVENIATCNECSSITSHTKTRFLKKHPKKQDTFPITWACLSISDIFSISTLIQVVVLSEYPRENEGNLYPV